MENFPMVSEHNSILPRAKFGPKVSFQHLPKEIRLQILRFSDLGLIKTHYERDPKTSHVVRRLVHLPSRQRDDQHKCCGVCTFSDASWMFDCTASTSGFSTSCVCRPRPSKLSLCLVSKQMYIDASEVLYSARTFETESLYVMSIWLRTLTVSAKAWLRSVAFTIDLCAMNNFDMEEKSLLGRNLEWKLIIRYMARELVISKLNLRIDANIVASYPHRVDCGRDIRLFLRMVERLRPLGDLHGFRILLLGHSAGYLRDNFLSTPYALRYLLGYEDEELMKAHNAKQAESKKAWERAQDARGTPSRYPYTQSAKSWRLALSNHDGARLFRSWLVRFKPNESDLRMQERSILLGASSTL